jgi:hypothetical protein
MGQFFCFLRGEGAIVKIASHNDVNCSLTSFVC